MASAACPRSKATSLLKNRSSSPTIGYFYLDIAETRSEEGKLRLFVAIDRTSKFVYAELHRSAGKMEAAQFLGNPIAAVPYKLPTILTNNKNPVLQPRTSPPSH